jgi:UDP-N-acetylglucosamine 2-epimerase (non-hydrolysing)
MRPTVTSVAPGGLNTTVPERRILCIVGTRPEAIKMAPVAHALQRRGALFQTDLVATGQHRDLVASALAEFGLTAHRDLQLSAHRPDESLSDQASRLLLGIGGELRVCRPDLVLAQGDTATVLAAALACHLERIPLGHVEAGLRSHNRDQPFPEEGNRVVASHLSALHFAPTLRAVQNLRDEGIAPDAIVLTGNPVIDALDWMTRDIGRSASPSSPRQNEPILLVTLHRRESFGLPLLRVIRVVQTLLDREADLRVIWPVHPNPSVRGPVEALLSCHPRVELVEPQGYRAFVTLLGRARLVLTDSGGVQEEAPALGVPVVVAREATERPEALETGIVRLAGTEEGPLMEALESWWQHPPAAIGTRGRVFGDGRAAERIAHACARFLGLDSDPDPQDPPPCPVNP